jgi:hypothetical protein
MFFLLFFFFFFKIILSNDIFKNNNIILSLTSHPGRIKSVHIAIESLLNQSLKPDKIILWLTKSQFPNENKDLPNNILKLIEKNLFIEYYDKDIKSYTKLIPTLKKYPNNLIVTADDDIIYKNDWLENLYKTHLKYPKDIIAHRITKFIIKNKSFKTIGGGKDYYKKPSFLNKVTGVGGVLYFPNCFYKDILNEELFMKLAPTNDDIWFWLQAVLKGTKIRVVNNPQYKLNYVPNTQNIGLSKINDLGPKLFWKDFNNMLNHYTQLKRVLIKEYEEMTNINIKEEI